MLRNPEARHQREMRFVARREIAAVAGPARARVAPSLETGIPAGGIDADGNWRPYGLIGITPVGLPFRAMG